MSYTDGSAREAKFQPTWTVAKLLYGKEEHGEPVVQVWASDHRFRRYRIELSFFGKPTAGVETPRHRGRAIFADRGKVQSGNVADVIALLWQQAEDWVHEQVVQAEAAYLARRGAPPDEPRPGRKQLVQLDRQKRLL